MSPWAVLRPHARAYPIPTIEERMDDVRAVMEAVGSERAAIYGDSEGCALSGLFAATYPHRTTALVWYGGYARRTWAPDYPWAPTPEQWQRAYQEIRERGRQRRPRERASRAVAARVPGD